MDFMTSYWMRKHQRKPNNLDKLERTYIIQKRGKLKVCYRPQNRHLRPFYVIEVLKDLEFEKKSQLLEFIFQTYGIGYYVIIYNQKGVKGFQLYWKGKLPLV